MTIQGKVSFWNSLVVRYGLLFTGLLLASVLIAGYTVYQQASSLIVDGSKEQVIHDSQLARQSFFNLLEEVTNDIAVVTNNPSVLRYISDSSAFNVQQVSSLASVLLENKSEYYQLRILDATYGRERLRFNKDKAGTVFQTPKEDLQVKGDRTYFKNTVSNTAIDYYFSEINLNEEFGQVSTPYVPTLRAIGKIKDNQDNLEALLVINVDLTLFFTELEQIMESNSGLIITDNKGTYLFHKDASKRFGPQLRKDESFPKDFKVTWDALIKKDTAISISDFDNIEYVCQVNELSYSLGFHTIYLFTLIDLEMLLSEVDEVRNRSLKIIAGICMVALLFILLFTRLISNSINLVTRAVIDFENDQRESPRNVIPENRKDEVGLLARSFLRMKKRIEEQMIALKEGLRREQRAIELKDEFLQNMSHDLRTPLNAILGLTQLIKKNKPTAEQKPIIDSLHRSATNLSGLMYDVLDQHKLMEGRVRLKFATTNFYELLHDIYASYQYEAITKGISIDFKCDEILKQTDWMTDPLRFNQVITNLLINAIKYTNQGGVVFYAKILNGEEKNLEVRVRDTGIGISKDKIDLINNRFYQAHDEALSPHRDGFGLGLSIVKQLIELFDGSLKVTSEPGIGSEFTITIPVAPSDKPSKGNVQNPLGLKWPELKNGYKLLHIEDDNSAILMVNDVLNYPNISLKQVPSIDTALALLKTESYDLIVTDVMLQSGKVNGEKIQLFHELSDASILIVSALEKEDMSKLSSYYLQKPIDLDQFRDIVIKLLGKSEFDMPYMNDIRTQYDHIPDKISNYLKILISEFDTYIARVEQLNHSFDEAEWKAINHKIITHIKLMRLDRLSELMTNGSMPDIYKMNELINHLKYHLCCFRDEFRANSET